MDTSRTAVGFGWLGSHLATPVLAAVLIGTGAFADVLDVMRGELDRSHQVFSEQPTPIYYLSYEITEDKTASVNGAFGALTGWNEVETPVLPHPLAKG